MNLGRRIVYDSVTGAIIMDTGEQSGTDVTERPIWNGVTYIDIPYGQDIDKYNRVVKYHVDINTKTVIFDELAPIVVSTDDKNRVLTQNLLIINKNFTVQNKTADTLKEILDALKSLNTTTGGN